MVRFIEVLAGILLLMIFVQDMKSRSVHWVLFPLLALSFVLFFYAEQHSLSGFWLPALVNVAFILSQLGIITLWFSLRRRKWMSIADSLLGWGDILFLLCLTCCFSPFNYVLFYLGSLILILLVWLIGRRTFFHGQASIPLAGLQALLLLVVFITARLDAVNLMSDAWVLHYLPL